MAKINASIEKRIDDQRAIIAALAPETEAHKIATLVLLMLEQMRDIEAAVAALAAKQRNDHR